jgi:hypothetical protein
MPGPDQVAALRAIVEQLDRTIQDLYRQRNQLVLQLGAMLAQQTATRQAA